MKCPKCGYLGFEDADKCRNCGYDFSLSSPSVVPDLPLRTEPPAEKPIDPGPRSIEGELPLFRSSVHDEHGDEPMIKVASAPRTPLSVRRSTPEVPRVRADQPRPQSFDLVPDTAEKQPARAVGISSQSRGDEESAADGVQPAGVMARLVAVAIDGVILGIVDAIVVYFTLRILGLTLQDYAQLPKGPMIAFLLVQNGGYLVVFTAGGQTLGKMAAGIRVVATEPGSPLDVGHAFVREALWLLLAAPVGLGFLPALFSRDGRGLHDRLSGTRVVR